MGRRVLLLALALVLLTAPAAARAQATYTNPVIPGDQPDPSVVRAQGAYLASTTTSAWVPAFPLFRSTDLVNWQRIGAVLPEVPPWVTGRMWAPEIVHGADGYRAYWSAQQRGGTRASCIALSTATRATGPWTYRGRVTCPAQGAIDPQPVRDADGSRWLLYRVPRGGGPIMLQRLDPSGLHTVGAPQVLLLPDAPWEQGVSEGPSVVRLAGQWVLFYSGGSCCSVPCSYAEGVARAPALQGPYVKDPENPILRTDPAWTCPGHGTVIRTASGTLAFLHHAFAAGDLEQRRRPVLLDPVGIGPDGWPTMGQAGGSATTAPSPTGAAQRPVAPGFSDAFAAGLQPGWEWLVDGAPTRRVTGGALTLGCAGPLRFVARQVTSDAFVATASVRAPTGTASAGLGVDLGRVVRGVELRGGRLRGFSAGPRGVRVGPAVRAPAGRRTLRLVVTVNAGGIVGTYVVGPSGALQVVPAGPAAHGGRPTRVALTCRGTGDATFANAGAR